jgi:DNA-binding PadR family transcriptional regulator
MRSRSPRDGLGRERWGHEGHVGERSRWDGPTEYFGSFGFGGPRRGRGRGGPGGRARRGDVRAAVLALLAERPMHGYEMIQELEERTGGVWRPSPGAVYPALQLLEDQGLVRADTDGEKRRYELTDAGREELAKAGDRKPWDDVTAGMAPTQLRLGKAIQPLAIAAAQVLRAGDERQQAAAADVLNEARRRLYAILAEDGDATAAT